MRQIRRKLKAVSSSQKYQIGWPTNKRRKSKNIRVFVISNLHHRSIGRAESRNRVCNELGISFGKSRSIVSRNRFSPGESIACCQVKCRDKASKNLSQGSARQRSRRYSSRRAEDESKSARDRPLTK